ncbi:hypothetical protein CHUAL_009638 [Chamberlinius hualienensis]
MSQKEIKVHFWNKEMNKWSEVETLKLEIIILKEVGKVPKVKKKGFITEQREEDQTSEEETEKVVKTVPQIKGKNQN